MLKLKYQIMLPLVAMTLLSGCHRGVIPTSDYIAKSNIPAPVWLPDSVVTTFAQLPQSQEFDTWLIRYTTQQEKLEALNKSDKS